MKENIVFAERRQHKRSDVKNIIVGILNAPESEIVGAVTDISMSGVKFTYNELRSQPGKHAISSIDLIADDNYLFEVPCDCAWHNRVETESDSEFSRLRQYGIQFGKLNRWQFLLLQNIIADCASLETSNRNSNQ